MKNGENTEEAAETPEGVEASEKNEDVKATDSDDNKQSQKSEDKWDSDTQAYIKMLREENKSKRLKLEEKDKELKEVNKSLEKKEEALNGLVERLKSEKIETIVDTRLSVVEDEKKRQKIKKLVMSEAEYEFDDELNLKSNFDDVIAENLELFKIEANNKQKNAVYNTQRPASPTKKAKEPSNWKEAFDQRMRQKINEQ